MPYITQPLGNNSQILFRLPKQGNHTPYQPNKQHEKRGPGIQIQDTSDRIVSTQIISSGD